MADGSLVPSIISSTGSALGTTVTVDIQWSFPLSQTVDDMTLTLPASSTSAGGTSVGTPRVGETGTIMVSAPDQTNFEITRVTFEGSEVTLSATGAASVTVGSSTSAWDVYVGPKSQPATYYIQSSIGSSGGSISPIGTVNVTEGDDQTFTMTANTGYTISTLVVDGSLVSAASGRSSYSYTFTNITANHTIAVSFSQVTYTITSSATTGGTVSPSGSVSVTSGASQQFTATPSSGYKLSHWLVDGTTGGSSLTYTFYSVTANHTIQAVFVKTYTIQATAPTHGTVTITAGGSTATASAGQTASLVVDTGTSATFACAMDTGYNFAAWTEGGSSISTSASYTATITSDRSLTATETATAYTITATAGEGGSISPSGAVSVNHGGSQTFTATANTGYRFDHWVVDGEIEPDE